MSWFSYPQHGPWRLLLWHLHLGTSASDVDNASFRHIPAKARRLAREPTRFMGRLRRHRRQRARLDARGRRCHALRLGLVVSQRLA